MLKAKQSLKWVKLSSGHTGYAVEGPRTTDRLCISEMVQPEAEFFDIYLEGSSKKRDMKVASKSPPLKKVRKSLCFYLGLM